jgi:L-alanine-DL-glutamate epimerase-like enolase superfamily enzyme
MSTAIVGIALIPLNLPMHQPFVTAQGKRSMAQNLLVAVRLKGGITGYAEGSSSLAWPSETPQAMARVLQPLVTQLIGKPISSFRSMVRWVWERAGQSSPAAASALECALIDAYTRQIGIPLWRWLGGRQRSIATALTISAWDHDLAARVARRAQFLGFRRLKVKIAGRDLDEDIRRLVAVHRAAPKVSMWVDANQGLTRQEAIHLGLFLKQHRLPVRLIEQPVDRHDWEGLKAVEQSSGIPVAADESARTVEDALGLIRKRMVSALNIKLAKTGLMGSVKIIRRAQAAGVRLMIGCMAESRIGIAHSVALACGSGAFSYVDLDSPLLVISPRCQTGFRFKRARWSVCPNCPGSGVLYPAP